MFKLNNFYLFRYNIRYGKVTASDEEVEKAAAVADIHERILTFPEGILLYLLFYF